MQQPQVTPAYGPPHLLRASSPATSAGSSHAEGDDPGSDEEGDDATFAAKCSARLQLGEKGAPEILADRDPLLNFPDTMTEIELKGTRTAIRIILKRFLTLLVAASERILTAMRYRVHLLEENEMFEQTLLRGSKVGQDAQPSSADIDVLMRGLMATAGPSTSQSSTRQPVSDGPWNGPSKVNFMNKSGSTINGSNFASTSGQTARQQGQGGRL